MTFLSKVTTANELVVDLLRNGSTHDQAMNVQSRFDHGAVDHGQRCHGPNFRVDVGNRGYFPSSPNGSVNATWDTTSVAAASGPANASAVRF